VGLLIPCSQELVGSNPTPRVILLDSSKIQINLMPHIFIIIGLAGE
jgi:hypothetical protein